MTDNENKFWAFLSYSPQDNCGQRSDTPEAGRRCWGNWLQDALKTFSIPAEFVGQINGRGEIIPKQIDPIFRDEQELPANANLSADIRQALERSICLVVICSPRSARSGQVNEAVRYFKQLGRGQQILPIVVAGEPNASDGNPPGRSPADECFVPALRHPLSPDGTLDTTRRAGKSIFVDARHGVEKREILAHDHRNAEADLEMAKIQLIALLIGVGFNGLWWREQKRHYFDFAAAQHQAREALNQVEEVRRQLQEAQRHTREAQNQALEVQNLPRDVQDQIQEAQNQVLAAQREAQTAQSQLEEIRHQAQDAQNKFLAAQSQIQEFEEQSRSAQNQLAAARQQVLEAESKVLAALDEARAAQHQVQEIQNQTRDAQSQINAAHDQVRKIQNQGRNARRLAKVLAVLAVLALLAAGQAWRQRQTANQVLARAIAPGQFELAPDGLNQKPIRPVLSSLGGAEQAENLRRSLDGLAASISLEEIPEALQASAVLLNDQQRSHFQKWLLVRLGWVNPASAMTSARAIEGKIVNDQGLGESNRYFQLAVLDNWIQTDLPGALSWVGQLPAANARQCALKHIIPWVQSPPDAAAKRQTLDAWLDERAQTDISGALALSESLPARAWRDTVLARLWLKTDPFAVSAWLRRLELPLGNRPPREIPPPWTQFQLNPDASGPIETQPKE